MRVGRLLALIALPLATGSCAGGGEDGATTVARPERRDPLNLIANASFETTLRYWRSYPGASLTRTTSEHKVGIAAARAFTAVNPGEYGAYSLGVVANPQRGDRFAFSAWVKGGPSTVGKRAILSFSERGGTAEYAIVARTQVELADRWRRGVAAGAVRGTGRAAIDVHVLLRDRVAIGDEAFIDGARLEWRSRPPS